MKRIAKVVLLTAIAVSLLSVASMVLIRRHNEIILRERIAAYRRVYSQQNWGSRCNESTRILLQVMIISESRLLEDHLSHPFRLEPVRSHGVYETFIPSPLQSNSSKLMEETKTRMQFQAAIGVTNQDAEASLMRRYAEAMQKELLQSSQPVSACDSSPRVDTGRGPQEK